MIIYQSSPEHHTVQYIQPSPLRNAQPMPCNSRAKTRALEPPMMRDGQYSPTNSIVSPRRRQSRWKMHHLPLGCLFLLSVQAHIGLPVVHAFLERLQTVAQQQRPWHHNKAAVFKGSSKPIKQHPCQNRCSSLQSNLPPEEEAQTRISFDDIVMKRTACKKFLRYDGNHTTTEERKGVPPLPSQSDPSVVKKAWHSLRLAQRAPSSFNTQPYKVVLVHSKEQKQKLSRYALGPNQKRVLDSDCTAIFLADREVMRTLPKFLKFQLASLPPDKQPNRVSKFLLLFYISLFSSGYPLPRFLAAPLSFLIRLVFSVTDCLTRWFYVLPSLSNAESWATKQVLPVAMIYMLACTNQNVATCPMEGINAAGIRRVLKIPRRYSIPLIVTTGIPYTASEEKEVTSKESSLSKPSQVARYAMEEMIFSNQFGESDLCVD